MASRMAGVGRVTVSLRKSIRGDMGRSGGVMGLWGYGLMGLRRVV